MTEDRTNLIRPGLWVNSKYLEDVKKRLRAKVPKISLYDIRIDRLSHNEAIIHDLYEGGYRQSAQFIEDLIKMEDEYDKSKKISQLYLKVQAGKKCLLTIAEYFKKAELKLHEGDKVGSIEKILKLAEHLAREEQQLWIVEQIYLVTIRATNVYRLDGGLLEARVRYYYGRFLIEKCGLYDVAYETLKIAYQMSVAREWRIEQGLGLGKDLCKEVNYLLFLCLSAKESNENYGVALEYSKKALKHALASENKFIIPRAYIERGDREMDAKNYSEATNFYSKGITFAQVSSQSDYICKGYLRKGYALLKMGYVSRATSFAKLAKRAAEESGSQFYQAKAYMLFGEIAVSRAFMSIAGYNFMLAVDIFNELGEEKLAQEARFLGAFAMSHIVLEKLVEIIRKSDQDYSSECFHRLEQWKERRTPFWESGDESCTMKKITDGSTEVDRRKSLFTDFGFYESFPGLEKKESDSAVTTNCHKHLFEMFREFISTF